MLSPKRLTSLYASPSTTTTFSIIVVSFSLILKLIGTFYIKNQISHLTKEYRIHDVAQHPYYIHSITPSRKDEANYQGTHRLLLIVFFGNPGYLGSDYPESWPIKRDPVLMQFENPEHFKLDAPDGALEWKAIVSSDGSGVVHLGPHRQPYSIGMMHQLGCLNAIREELIRDRKGKDDPPSEISRHCMNYMRQMLMCRGDWELESFQFASHKNPIDWRGVYQCKDWEAVYKAVGQNQEDYAVWMGERKRQEA